MGEQMNFMKARINDKKFSYDTACPSCGSGEEHVKSLEEQQLCGDDRTEAEVSRIMKEAYKTFDELGASKNVLITKEELENLKDS